MSGVHTLLMLCSNEELSHLTVIVKIKFYYVNFKILYLFNQHLTRSHLDLKSITSVTML